MCIRDRPPAEEGSRKQAFIAIRAWVRGCIESNRLCPMESERPYHPANNISAYVSGSGDFNGAPSELDRCAPLSRSLSRYPAA